MDRWLDCGKPSFILRRSFNFRLIRRHAHLLRVEHLLTRSEKAGYVVLNMNILLTIKTACTASAI
jgi:hypothetical protein